MKTMVQEIHVLKCFACETFQSHIVKKTIKWECKVCGVKQSIKKVYGRGSGKDCRLHTQKLNALKNEKEDIKFKEEEEENKEITPEKLDSGLACSFTKTKPLSSEISKWSEYEVNEVNINNKKTHNYLCEQNSSNSIQNKNRYVGNNMRVKRKYYETDLVEEEPFHVSVGSENDVCSVFSSHSLFVNEKKTKSEIKLAEIYDEDENYYLQQNWNIDFTEGGKPEENKNISFQPTKQSITVEPNKPSISKWAKFLEEDKDDKESPPNS